MTTVTLSTRQIQVLELMAQGLTDAEIADRLRVGIATVYTHGDDVRAKLGARNRAQAVAKGYERGYLGGGR